MLKKYLYILASWLLFASGSTAQVKFKFNNVDTISPFNQQLITFFGRAMEAKASGKHAASFWYIRGVG